MTARRGKIKGSITAALVDRKNLFSSSRLEPIVGVEHTNQMARGQRYRLIEALVKSCVRLRGKISDAILIPDQDLKRRVRRCTINNNVLAVRG